MLCRWTIPFCIFDTPVDQLALSFNFIVDLWALLQEEHVTQRSHYAIASCILNGAYARECITRTINKGKSEDDDEGFIGAPRTFAIICSLLLRPRYPLPDTAIKRLDFKEKYYPDHIREDILELLYRYGVKCARGECCGVLRKPKEKACEHTVAS